MAYHDNRRDTPAARLPAETRVTVLQLTVAGPWICKIGQGLHDTRTLPVSHLNNAVSAVLTLQSIHHVCFSECGTPASFSSGFTLFTPTDLHDRPSFPALPSRRLAIRIVFDHNLLGRHHSLLQLSLCKTKQSFSSQKLFGGAMARRCCSCMVPPRRGWNRRVWVILKGGDLSFVSVVCRLNQVCCDSRSRGPGVSGLGASDSFLIL
ncbi:hypothetical protein VTK56DRAFT_4432 [Thermocarpiscus australiensis]